MTALPPAFIEELSTLQDHVPPLLEQEVVQVMEHELRCAASAGTPYVGVSRLGEQVGGTPGRRCAWIGHAID